MPSWSYGRSHDLSHYFSLERDPPPWLRYRAGRQWTQAAEKGVLKTRKAERSRSDIMTIYREAEHDKSNYNDREFFGGTSDTPEIENRILIVELEGPCCRIASWVKGML